MRHILTIILLLFTMAFLAEPSLAAVRCETQYGGREVCITTGQLQVNKEVFDPPNNKFVDNLGINDHRFAPGELVAFKIKVKNVGDAKLDKVTVTDNPQANFFELATGALNFEITDLKVGETQERELKLRVLNEGRLPQNNIICVINAAEAVAGNEKDRDTAQLCLERKVIGVEKGAPPPVKELPPTGGEIWLALFGSAFGAAAGFKLRKFGAVKSFESYYWVTEDRLYKKGRG